MTSSDYDTDEDSDMDDLPFSLSVFRVQLPQYVSYLIGMGRAIHGVQAATFAWQDNV